MNEVWIEELTDQVQADIISFDLNELRGIKKVSRNDKDFKYTSEELKIRYNESTLDIEKSYYNLLNILKKVPRSSKVYRKIYGMIIMMSEASMEDYECRVKSY